MRNFENIPALLQPGEGAAEWEARRKATVETVADIEYDWQCLAEHIAHIL